MKSSIRPGHWLGLMIASIGMIACSTPDNGIGQSIPAQNSTGDRQSLTNEYAAKERARKTGSNSATGGINGNSSSDRIEYGQQRGSSGSSYQSQKSWMDSLGESVLIAGTGLLMGVPQFLGATVDKIGDQVSDWFGNEEETKDEAEEKIKIEKSRILHSQLPPASNGSKKAAQSVEDSSEKSGVALSDDPEEALRQIQKLLKREPADMESATNEAKEEIALAGASLQEAVEGSPEVAEDESKEALGVEIHPETCEDKSQIAQMVEEASRQLIKGVAGQVPTGSSQGGEK